MSAALHTNPTKPTVLLEILAEGGSLTIVGIKADTGWRCRLVRNECALYDLLSGEDREGLVFYEESRWGTWEDALALIDKYQWHRLHPGKVHPEFRQRVWAAVQSNGTRIWPSSLRLKMRRLRQYLTRPELRKDARRAKARAREQLNEWRRVCRALPSIVATAMDNPETLRTHAALFERMRPSTDATVAAANALRFMANEFERRSGVLGDLPPASSQR
jgi:hypothetical protein